MTAFEFSKYTITIFLEYDFIRCVEIQLLDEPVTMIKAVINDDVFINTFHNSETLRYSFALIKNSRRIFGADNAKSSHIHPFNEPDNHRDSNEIFYERLSQYTGSQSRQVVNAAPVQSCPEVWS